MAASTSVANDTGRNAPAGKVGAVAITRQHWLPDSTSPTCMNPECKKPFKSAFGPSSDRRSHCRRCGKLYCRDCVRFERRLDSAAKPSDTGFLEKVCLTCFVDPSEPGSYMDRFAIFNSSRVPGISAAREVDKIWKRKISTIVEKGVEGAKAIGVIQWQQDSQASFCPKCHNNFGTTLRKHHCRLCGRVFCGACTSYRVSLTDNDSDNRGAMRSCQVCWQQCRKVRRRWKIENDLSVAEGHPLLRSYRDLQFARKAMAKGIERLESQCSASQQPLPPNASDSTKTGRAQELQHLRERKLQMPELIRRTKEKLEHLTNAPANAEVDKIVIRNIQKSISEAMCDSLFRFRSLQRDLESIFERDKALWELLEVDDESDEEQDIVDIEQESLIEGSHNINGQTSTWATNHDMTEVSPLPSSDEEVEEFSDQEAEDGLGASISLADMADAVTTPSPENARRTLAINPSPQSPIEKDNSDAPKGHGTRRSMMSRFKTMLSNNKSQSGQVTCGIQSSEQATKASAAALRSSIASYVPEISKEDGQIADNVDPPRGRQNAVVSSQNDPSEQADGEIPVNVDNSSEDLQSSQHEEQAEDCMKPREGVAAGSQIHRNEKTYATDHFPNQIVQDELETEDVDVEKEQLISTPTKEPTIDQVESNVTSVAVRLSSVGIGQDEGDFDSSPGPVSPSKSNTRSSLPHPFASKPGVVSLPVSPMRSSDAKQAPMSSPYRPRSHSDASNNTDHNGTRASVDEGSNPDWLASQPLGLVSSSTPNQDGVRPSVEIPASRALAMGNTDVSKVNNEHIVDSSPVQVKPAQFVGGSVSSRGLAVIKCTLALGSAVIAMRDRILIMDMPADVSNALTHAISRLQAQVDVAVKTFNTSKLVNISDAELAQKLGRQSLRLPHGTDALSQSRALEACTGMTDGWLHVFKHLNGAENDEWADSLAPLIPLLDALNTESKAAALFMAAE